MPLSRASSIRRLDTALIRKATLNSGTTPQVQYAYSQMADGANHSRLVSMTYPNGRVVNYNYTIGLDATISRLSSISDSSATLESYKYLGLGTMVVPLTVIDVTLLTESGEGITSSQPAGRPAEWEDSCPISYPTITSNESRLPARMARFRAAPTPQRIPWTLPASHLLAA